MKRFIDFTKKEEELEVVRESFNEPPVEKEPEIIRETVREVTVREVNDRSSHPSQPFVLTTATVSRGPETNSKAVSYPPMAPKIR